MALTVKGIPKLTKPGRYNDVKELYLEVAPGSKKTGKPAARSGVSLYQRADTRPGREAKRRERWFWLGSAEDAVTLEEAGERARKARVSL